MPVSAPIGFVQGVTTTNPGVAMIGVVGSPVTVYTATNPDNQKFTYTLVSVPSTSALLPNIYSNGSLAQVQFTPDVAGGYLWDLVTTDQFGNSAHDQRVFQVREISGRIIPPAAARDDSLNFIIGGVMNTAGWAPFLTDYLRTLDLTISTQLYTLSGPNIVAGDWVCLVSASSNHLLVTKALPTPLAAAGGVLGMAVASFTSGATDVLVAIGGTAPASVVSDIGSGTSGQLCAVNASARAVRLSSPSVGGAGEFPVGIADASGKLTIGIMRRPATHVTTIPALRSVDPRGLANGMIHALEYDTGLGAAGGGKFKWDPTITTEDGPPAGLQIRPTGWVGSGGWNRMLDNGAMARPEMFGAKADGVTDDHDAIQAAINAIVSLAVPLQGYGAGNVLFDAKKYVCGSPLNLPAQVNLVGKGKRQSQVVFPGVGHGLKNLGQQNGNAMQFQSVRRLSVACTAAQPSGGAAIASVTTGATTVVNTAAPHGLTVGSKDVYFCAGVEGTPRDVNGAFAIGTITGSSQVTLPVVTSGTATGSTGKIYRSNTTTNAGTAITAVFAPACTVAGTSSGASGKVRIQTTVAHGYTTGQTIAMANILGTTEANGTFALTVIDSTHFDLTGTTYVHAWVANGNGLVGSTTNISTSTAHGLAVGDMVMATDVGGVTALEGTCAEVVSVPTSTSITFGALAQGAWTSGGTLRKIVTGSAGAGLMQLGGTFLDIHDCAFSGWRDCVVFDQTETSVIDRCNFNLYHRAGIFVANGAEYTAGSAGGFTNAIVATRNNFDGGLFGVIANGGVQQSYEHNAFQHHLMGGAYFGSVTPCTFHDNYTECDRPLVISGSCLAGNNPGGASGQAGGVYYVTNSILGGNVGGAICISPWGGMSGGPTVAYGGNYLNSNPAQFENPQYAYWHDLGGNLRNGNPLTAAGAEGAWQVTWAPNSTGIGIGTFYPGGTSRVGTFYGIDARGQMAWRQNATPTALGSHETTLNAQTVTGTGWRFTLSADSVLGGLSNGFDGLWIKGTNVSAYTLTIKNEDTSAAAVDRIRTTGQDVDIPPNGSFLMHYDVTTQRYMLTSYNDYHPDARVFRFVTITTTNSAAQQIAAIPLVADQTTILHIDVVGDVASSADGCTIGGIGTSKKLHSGAITTYGTDGLGEVKAAASLAGTVASISDDASNSQFLLKVSPGGSSQSVEWVTTVTRIGRKHS